MTVVGYTTSTSEKAWIVKNSWGPNWGENGYIRIKYVGGAVTGLCYLTRYVSALKLVGFSRDFKNAQNTCLPSGCGGLYLHMLLILNLGTALAL